MYPTNAVLRRQATMRWTNYDLVEHKRRAEAEATRRLVELEERMLNATERLVDLAQLEQSKKVPCACTVDYGDLSEAKAMYSKRAYDIKVQLRDGLASDINCGCGCGGVCKAGMQLKTKAQLEWELKCAETCLETIEGLESAHA